jgi:hypothetical protein
MTPPKSFNFPITESKNTKMVEMLEKEFKSLVLKTVNDLKEDLNK